MKQHRILFIVFTLTTMLLSACAAESFPLSDVDSEQNEVEPDLIVIGVIESMNGTEWIVNDRTLIVDPSVVHDGPHNVGEIITAEGNVQSDGRVLVSRVDDPDRDDLATATAQANDNPNDNGGNNDNDDDDGDNSGPGGGDDNDDDDNSGPGGGGDD